MLKVKEKVRWKGEVEVSEDFSAIRSENGRVPTKAMALVMALSRNSP